MDSDYAGIGQEPADSPALRRASTYALEPRAKWVRPGWPFFLLGAAYIGLAVVCFVVDPGPLLISIIYSAMAVSGLVYRVVYFARRQWLLYFIDLCFVTTIVLLATLWVCHDYGGAAERCPQGWLIAVYAVCSGPVPGATFMLQQPLALHHPEAFEGFFLHATPMWVSYYRRWRWGIFTEAPPVLDIMWYGFSRFYLPWVVCYLAFMLVQPLMCDLLAGSETLLDGFVFSGSPTHEERLKEKRENYFRYELKIVAFVFVHAVMSGSGFAAAALAFRDWNTQVVWLVCVQIGGIASGYHFYARSLNPDYEAPGFLAGFIRMALAWCAVLPTYLLSTGAIPSPI